MEISAKTKLMTNSTNGIQREIKVKGQMLVTVCNKLQVPELSSCFRLAQNKRFSQELCIKPLQLLQSWSQFGEITYLLDQWWKWCPTLSFPYFCMPMNHVLHHGVSRAEFSLTETIPLQAAYVDHSWNPRLLYGLPGSRTHGHWLKEFFHPGRWLLLGWLPPSGIKKISIGGRNIMNLQFADDIYALAEEE